MDRKIAVIGLGYVGLPLAVEFGKLTETLGFDINSKRVEELKGGKDHTLETTPEDLEAAHQLIYTDDPQRLKDYDFYIVTVPTPIDEFNKPDLTPLVKSSEMISQYLSKGDIVVYESTVYAVSCCLPFII